METGLDPVIWDKTREDFERTFFLSRFGDPTPAELSRGYRVLLWERAMVAVRDPYCKNPRWAMQWDPPGVKRPAILYHGTPSQMPKATQRKTPVGPSQSKRGNPRTSQPQGR